MFFDSGRVSELEKQLALMSERWRHRDEEYRKMLLLVQNFQDQLSQMSDKSEMLMLIKNVVGQHIKEVKPDESLHPTVMCLERGLPYGEFNAIVIKLSLKHLTVCW